MKIGLRKKFLKSRYYEGKKYPRSPPDIFSIIKEGFTKQKLRLEITPQIEQNERPINSRKMFEFNSFIMGYQVYKDCWAPL